MSKSAAVITLGAVIAVGVLLQGLSADEMPVGSGAGSRPAIGTPAPAVAATSGSPAAAAPAAAGAAVAPAGTAAAPAGSGPAIPALTAETERLATQAQRQEALPVFLQAAEATLSRVRGELAQLEARGAPAAEIAAKAAQLRQLTDVRAAVLARNADITPAR